MNQVVLERDFAAPLEKVYAFISKPENLSKWWGPDGCHLPDFKLDFEQTGSWHSVMRFDSGNEVKVSGEVTHVDPPNSVGFTWAWHDGGPGGPRGTKSQVRIEIGEVDEHSAKLTLNHFNLGTDSARAGHTRGWMAIFDNLESGLSCRSPN